MLHNTEQHTAMQIAIQLIEIKKALKKIANERGKK
jgi:hypothetical protein